MKVQTKDQFGGNQLHKNIAKNTNGRCKFGYDEEGNPTKFVKVVFDRRKITQDTNKRQVTCKLYCYLEFNMPRHWQNTLTYNTDFVVTGVAKCSPDDEFDFEKGRLIAQSEAENAAYRVGYRMIEQIRQEMGVLVFALNGQIDFLNQYYEHNTKFIDDIVTGKYIPKKKEQK